MLEFFKNLVRKGDAQKALPIRFDEIPGMLDRERQAAASRLAMATEGERSEIHDAAGRLLEVIRILNSARFDEGIHPKLRSIAQKSLPLYAKAIEAALEKPLPDAPEEFYTAAAELLKTCINSAQGQGKYLRTVFPEEMKAVSACVADIGRAINAMNQPVGEYRDVMARINEAARLHAALVDIDLDLKKSREKGERLARRIQETRDRIAACEGTLSDLDRERKGREIAGKEEELQKLFNARDLTMRRYAALSMTASHVLRKAEKVARRLQKPADERAIARAIPILSDHAVPGLGDLTVVLDAAFLATKRMIDSGDMALKNKEERSLFSSTESFSGSISALSATYAAQAAACDATERAFLSHPVIARSADLNRELQSLSDTLEKELAAHAELIRWREGLAGTIPTLREQLKKVAGMIYSGNDVQIYYADG